MLLYIIRKSSVFPTKSNNHISCSVNSVSGSAHKNFGPMGDDLLQNRYVDPTHMGLNMNLAEETHMGIDIKGPLWAPIRAQKDLIWFQSAGMVANYVDAYYSKELGFPKKIQSSARSNWGPIYTGPQRMSKKGLWRPLETMGLKFGFH